MDIPYILEREYPACGWVHRGDVSEYDNLEWTDGQDIPKPLLLDLIALWNDKYLALWNEDKVRQQRRIAFEERTTGDQLDAIIKSLKCLQTNGVDIGAEGADLVAWSDGIKTLYPKPQPPNDTTRTIATRPSNMTRVANL